MQKKVVLSWINNGFIYLGLPFSILLKGFFTEFRDARIVYYVNL
jgi:hypothetical protein